MAKVKTKAKPQATKTHKARAGRSASRSRAVSPAAQPAPPTTLARNISWWALLAMVFVVPLATSNFTVLGAQQSFTADVFEIVKVSIERILVLIALAAPCARELAPVSAHAFPYQSILRLRPP